MALAARAIPVHELTKAQRSNGCVAYDPTATAPTYGYDASIAPGVVFTAFFSISIVKQYRAENGGTPPSHWARLVSGPVMQEAVHGVMLTLSDLR